MAALPSSRPSTALTNRSSYGANPPATAPTSLSTAAAAKHLTAGGKDTSRLTTSRSSVLSRELSTSRSGISVNEDDKPITTARTRRLIPPLKGMDSAELAPPLPKPANPRPRSENDDAHDAVLLQLNNLKLAEHKWQIRGLELGGQIQELSAIIASIQTQIQQRQAALSTFISYIPLIARGEPLPAAPGAPPDAAAAPPSTSSKDRPAARTNRKDDRKASVDPISQIPEAERATYIATQARLCEQLMKIYRASDKRKHPETGEEVPRKPPACPEGMDQATHAKGLALRAARLKVEQDIASIRQQQLDTHLRHMENLQKMEALNRYALEHDLKDIARLSALLLQHKQKKIEEDTIWATGKPPTPTPVIVVEPPKKNVRRTRLKNSAAPSTTTSTPTPSG